MTTRLQLPALTTEAASALLLAHVRLVADPAARGQRAPGWEIDLAHMIRQAISEQRDAAAAQGSAGFMVYEYDVQTNAAPIHEAAWDLVGRGILRPSAEAGGAAFTGTHFALTAYGRRWLDSASGFEVFPTEYGRFGRLLASHAPHFGPGFHARGQEAVRCYQAHTYLACCAMCGAAAEAIVLALAVAKSGDESRVLREYNGAGGRSKVERLLMAQQNALVQRELPNYLDLLKYWRDSAAHGLEAPIAEGEAFTSLLLLLRFAQFAADRWTEITGRAG